MPPPDLTCASTKLDICHRLTQRVPPPSLMTASAWPNVCLHQTWWLSPHDQSQSSENINLTRPTPTQLRSPQRGIMVQPKLFSDSTLYIYTREQKTCKLYIKPYIQPYIPLIIRALRCVEFAFQTLHKAYINNTKILHGGGKNFTACPRVKNGKM